MSAKNENAAGLGDDSKDVTQPLIGGHSDAKKDISLSPFSDEEDEGTAKEPKPGTSWDEYDKDKNPFFED